MREFVVCLRHRAKATLRQVTVQAVNYYEASCLARASNLGYTVARVYPVNHDDDD
jgi:hypothetical protein